MQKDGTIKLEKEIKNPKNTLKLKYFAGDSRKRRVVMDIISCDEQKPPSTGGGLRLTNYLIKSVLDNYKSDGPVVHEFAQIIARHLFESVEPSPFVVGLAFNSAVDAVFLDPKVRKKISEELKKETKSSLANKAFLIAENLGFPDDFFKVMKTTLFYSKHVPRESFEKAFK